MTIREGERNNQKRLESAAVATVGTRRAGGRTRWFYAKALYTADGATLDDLREAVDTLEETTRIARRVLSGAHPLTADIEEALQEARAALHSSEAP